MCCNATDVQAAAGEARSVLWWPFTQHSSLSGDDAVTVIDSRAGESFAVWRPQQRAAGGWRGSEVQLQYDACASWWTQVGRGLVMAHEQAVGSFLSPVGRSLHWLGL